MQNGKTDNYLQEAIRRGTYVPVNFVYLNNNNKESEKKTQKKLNCLYGKYLSIIIIILF